MWIINFSKANCKNCYACVRACPVHAIEVKKEQAQIMQERCIGCGKCLKACPKNAKQVKTELENVKQYMKEEVVAASLAPAFAALFGDQSHKIPAVLKKLGFKYVEETVVGAEMVTRAYEAYGKMPGDQCYITSCCPTVNALIQKHYPEILPYLIPVVSPAACHARILKKKYGKEVKVVFIGPCLSKKIEGNEEEAIDAVLTFDELEQWIKEETIDLTDLPLMPFDDLNTRQRQYPIVGGVTKTIDQDKLPRKIIQIDGVEECMDMMEHIQKGNFKNTLLEVHGCRHSCVSGAGMPQDNVNVYERKERIKTYAQRDQETSDEMEEDQTSLVASVDLHKDFPSLRKMLKEPSEEMIQTILSSIGKETKLDELNCGSCGYHTCREKAVAVYNGMAEPNMCLPFMRQKAETLTNVLFEATPNMIIMVNNELEILEVNPAAKQFFEVQGESLKGFPIDVLLDVALFKTVQSTKKNILNQKGALKDETALVIQSVIWSEYQEVMLWIANDVTKDEELARQLKNMKIEAIDMAQQVINKQMTVAQEIASLLGETTAETKVTLTKLKQLIQKEEAFKQ